MLWGIFVSYTRFIYFSMSLKRNRHVRSVTANCRSRSKDRTIPQWMRRPSYYEYDERRFRQQRNLRNIRKLALNVRLRGFDVLNCTEYDADGMRTSKLNWRNPTNATGLLAEFKVVTGLPAIVVTFPRLSFRGCHYCNAWWTQGERMFLSEVLQTGDHYVGVKYM